ncbi:Fpg/Nei family DNA glycosylase [Streptomyces sp. NRRL WC-3549]|uniref:Fpg/Nei family DNA glycosylase n=1 Tax=Streptomyces sp. NRRL WC-3549 TaxID=1463925 RepID=UPI0004CA1419|nr:DNA-formamidopyrimidine glycosylase family protein [Streptomyces sp. NRRL WC-3549]
MPEGDTVLQTAKRLDTALAGQVLTRSDLRVPRFATADLSGRTVLDVTARGKHLLTRVEGGLTLHSHLRMDGAWLLYAPGERWRGGPAHQIRAVLETAERTAVGYRLPVLELLRTASEDQVVGHLGPDLLGPDWDPDTAEHNLLSDPGRPLGQALLDQRNLAGIGNVYACELCFMARATPWLPVGELPTATMTLLVRTAKQLLEANRDNPARTTTAPVVTSAHGHRSRMPQGRRSRERLFVYGRGDRPCLRCGTPVRRVEQDNRPTYWCPGCQSGPTP